MTGQESLAAFKKADALVKEGRYDDALAVPMIPSDKTLIEKRIAAAKQAAGANTAKIEMNNGATSKVDGGTIHG